MFPQIILFPAILNQEGYYNVLSHTRILPIRVWAKIRVWDRTIKIISIKLDVDLYKVSLSLCNQTMELTSPIIINSPTLDQFCTNYT